DDRLAAESNTRQEHFHLLWRGVLCFVEDDKRVIERTPAHIGQWRDLDSLLFEEALYALYAHQVVQGIVKWPQIGIYFLCQIAWQKTQTRPSLHSGAGKHQALHGFAFQRVDGAGHGQPGFTGTCGPDAEGDVVAQ